MAVWAASPPRSTMEMSRATAARSPARAPSTSTSGSYVRGNGPVGLDRFDGGDAGDAVLEDALDTALQRQPGDRAGVAGPRQLHLDDSVLAHADEVDVAPVHLEGGPDGVDGLEDGCFHGSQRTAGPPQSGTR